MKKLLLTLTSGLFLAAGLQAQLPMTRATFTGTYSPISLPAATLSTATGDDVAQSAIPIGFTFNYLGNNYTTIGVNTNGVASFDAVMSTSGTNNNLFATNGPNNSLAPWWDNLWSDTILYELQGAPGSQTFTIQWTNSLSYANTATQVLNFQVILYETTNVIEFSYGTVVPGAVAVNESASIGIEGATGGAGNYLDAVTGSAFTSNGMLEAALEWPSHNFRFTPGAPSPIAGGTYTVGVTGNYFSLSEAIADINHRGIAGPVALSLIDAQYDVTPANGDNFFPMMLGPVAGSSSTNTLMISPASGTSTLSSEGTISANGNCGNAASNTIINNGNEPILALVGVQYVTLQDIALTCSSTGIVDRGLQVINSSATLGSQNNTFRNITVMMNRGSIGCYGISQQAITNPTAASGSNSNNTYLDLDISNVFTGIYLNGNATFPDTNCVVGTSSPILFNSIGAATPDDLGGATTGATNCYGIRANNQDGVSIFNNEVRNLTNGGTGNVEGIVVDAGVGPINVFRNKVHDVNFSMTTGTTNVTGIRVNLANAAGASANVYNNFVYSLGSAYAGAPTATRAIRGIWVQSTGGGNAGSTINVDFNNVMIDNPALNLSSTCYETGSTTGPVINTRNNIFANFTAAQAGNAAHFCMASTNATAVGNTGSVSDYNDLYVNNTTNGYTGIGATTTYAALANWQTGMIQDLNSLALDPGFFSTTNLHISAVPLNNTANATGITWVTTDIDNQARSVTPDIGADEFTPLLLDAGITALVSPVNNGCHTATEQVTVTLKNYAAVPLDFTTDSVLITVNITGAVTQTLTMMVNDNTINGGVPVPSGSSIDVPVGTFNMTAAGTYMFDAYSMLTGDGNMVNDTLNTVTIMYGPGTAAVSSNGVCAGSSVTLTLTGGSPGGTIQWQSSTDGGATWNNETGTGFDSTTYVVIPTATTDYQVIYCGVTVSNSVTVTYNAFSSPVVTNDTVCGPGVVNLSASGSGNINWYADSTGGISLATSATYSPNVSVTDTFYVTNTSGNTTMSVGLYDNSAGGGMSASNNNLIFDVYSNCTLTGVYIYPAAVGNVTIDLEDNTNAIINTATFAVSAADVNQRTFVPLNFNLVPGTGMQLVRNATSVQCWRNNVGVTYPYTLPGILSITSSTAGAGFYYYFYDWQVSYGCESPRVPMVITVLAPPAIAVSAASTMLCAGDSTMLTVSSGNAGYAYTWSPAGTLSATTGSSVMATPSSTTTYTINADDSSTGCRAVDSILVTVNALPQVMTFSDPVVCPSAVDTITACGPASVGLTDNSAGGQMSGSLNNLIFDVLSNTTLFGVYVYPAAAGNVIIELQDNANNVINTVTFAATAADVGQKTYVPLNFNLTPATGMQLVRNPTSVQCWRNNVGVAYPYTLPGVLSITTSTAGGGFYYFFYDWQVCAPGAPYSYTWISNPTGFTGSGDSIFVSPTVMTQYVVTATDTVTGCVAQSSTTVDIAGLPDVTVSGPSSICNGDSAILVAIYTGGDGTMSYVWSNSLGSNDSVTVMPTVNTTYTVTGTDGCGSVDVDSFTVIVVSGAPSAAFTYTPIGSNLFDFVDGSTAATSWSWDFGDTQTSTSQSPTHQYAASGTYTVTLIVTNGCGTDTITQVIMADGIDHVVNDGAVYVYPNPANEVINIRAAANTVTSIELMDVQGRVLLVEEAAQGSTDMQMNVSGLAAGVYILKVNGPAGTTFTRVEIQ